MDQGLALACGPDTAVHITIAQHIFTATNARHQLAYLGEGLGRVTLDLSHLLGDGVTGNARRVAQAAANEDRVALSIFDDLTLDVLVDLGLDRGAEAGAHIDALGTKRQSGDQTATIGHTARGDHRHIDGVDRGRQQNYQTNIVFTGVTGAFKAIDADDVYAMFHSRHRVTDRGALVDHLDAIFLKARQVVDRRAACCLDDLDARSDDGFAIFVIGNGVDRGQKGQVDAEWLVGEGLGLFDLGQKLSP